MIGLIGAEEKTKQTLSEAGVTSGDKTTDPNFRFIVLSFVTMNFFLYGVIGLLFYTYTLNLKRQELLSRE
jgi:hypothetical protein